MNSYVLRLASLAQDSAHFVRYAAFSISSIVLLSTSINSMHCAGSIAGSISQIFSGNLLGSCLKSLLSKSESTNSNTTILSCEDMYMPLYASLLSFLFLNSNSFPIRSTSYPSPAPGPIIVPILGC